MVRRVANNRAAPPQEEGVNDPLANVEQFNIIQFLQEGDFNMPLDQFDQVPMEQKVDPVLHQQHMMMQQHPQMVQHLQQQHMYQQQNLQMAPGMPLMPAITDLTRHGSSSSPSTTNSDPPFSPEDMDQFGLGTQRMNRGVIPNDHILPPEMLQRQFIDPRQMQNQPMTSPQAAPSFTPLLHSQIPTPASYVQSISPDSQHDGQGFVQSNLYNALNVSSDDSISGNSEENLSSRKRPRMENSMDPVYIMSAALSGKMPGEDENMGQPTIKFYKFQEEQWSIVYDSTGTEQSQVQVHVVADKGFNYSANDHCFVNQKKNHFQVSVNIEAIDQNPPQLMKINNQLIPIEQFQLSFTGVKSECITSEVQIRQSTTDRKPVLHTPVNFKIVERRMTKVTVPRLHFSETTLNNQRKNLRPNPDQKYFQLVIRLHAIGIDGTQLLIQAFASERVIVRATNPGSFEPPEMVDASWNKNGPVLSTTGPVVIGKSDPRAQLTVDGDIYISGRVTCPSDLRLKENITEKEASDALENLQKLRIVDYFYKPEVAEKWGLSEEQRKRTGVIAQELAAVLPDAVKDLGDYLTVNESRVFYETVLATQELCRLTGDLDQKIDEKVDEISKRLAEYAHKKKLFGSVASTLNSDGKSLSASRASLDSALSVATITNTKKNRRTNRKKDRIERETERRQPKKLTHGTVIGLVGVMSFCLLAMSALYILDWHNRNYGYHHVVSHATTMVPKEGPGNLIIPLDTYVPISQPDAPPLAPFCPGGHHCREYCCHDYDEQNPGPPQLEDEHIDDDNEYSYKAEGHSDFKLKHFGNDVRISLPEMDMEIDERYCVEKSCVPQRKVYNLFIPITRYMPAVPIEVQIDVPLSKYINNCGYIPEFDNSACNEHIGASKTNSKIPTSTKMFENTFKVTAGQWSRSAYRYRVGYSSGLCEIPDNQFGSFYEEYNLIFYRVCKRPFNNGTLALGD